MDVSVIIVTYNSASCIGACLASIKQQTGVTAEIILVDNQSADNTLVMAGQSGVRVIANQQNVGFGRANNQAFAVSTGRFVFLINPDAELVEADALAKACATMTTNERWGLAGTRVVRADGMGEEEPATGYPGQRRVNRDFSGLPGKIAWVIGASMIVRREVYAALGGFDPAFFLYSEETDLCLRVREAGHEIGYIDKVSVRHIGGKSESEGDPYDMVRRKMTGMHRFWKKHYSADDAARLVRRDLYRARFRMLWYGFRKRFQPGGTANRKHRQYRAIWEVSRDYLAANPAGSTR